jgi:hypothetical protein
MRPTTAFDDNVFDINALLHPGTVFDHPREVLTHPSLSISEKRAILASWASDASAISSCPALRAPAGLLTIRPSRLAFNRAFQLQRSASRLNRLSTDTLISAITCAPTSRTRAPISTLNSTAMAVVSEPYTSCICDIVV